MAARLVTAVTGEVTVPEELLPIGEGYSATVGGFELNLDTIAATVAAGLIVIISGLLARRGEASARPTKLRLAWETVISAVERQVGPHLGAAGRRVVPLAVALFVFVLTACLLETIPSGHPNKALPAPTGDLNLTVALGLFVVTAVHVTAVRTRGWRGYLRHYLRPTPWLLPLRLLEELVKPATLALRLFGNIFAGEVMVMLIFELVPLTVAPLPLLAWKLFSVFVAGTQAFIFALLTVLYFDAALAPDGTEAHANEPSPTVAGGTTP